MLIFLPISSHAEELKGINNKELAYALGASSIISSNENEPNTPFNFRVFVVPTEINECWGKIESCPDHKLFITVTTGDIYDTPSLYQLPTAKGWDVVESLGTRNGRREIGLKIQTMLPSANINIEERQKWEPAIYHVWLSEYSATIETK